MESQTRFAAGSNEARFSPGAEEFVAMRGEHRAAMVTTEVSSDLHTPVSAFMKLAGRGPCFLLESAESGRMWGRYSFLGFEPAAMAESRRGTLTVTEDGGAREVPGNPVRALLDLVEGARVHVPTDDMPFSGGAVGYFGYETVRHLERVPAAPSPGGAPEMMFMFPGRLVAFDHLRSRIRLHCLAPLSGSRRECLDAHASAVRGLEEMIAGLNSPLGPEASRVAGVGGVARGVHDQDRCGSRSPGSCALPGFANMTREEFESTVAAAREHVHAGDVFQVVVSARFGVPFDGDPLDVYRRLRAENPSPYMFYMRLGDLSLVGSSPEPMVTRRAGEVMIRPIAGTRPRGDDPAGDEALAAELVSDAKEKAEHVMLVDLARNDLGRVCLPGTVRVTRLMDVERYSRVMHMVSEVRGELDGAAGNYDVLRAAFPAGTVSGAPKIRACELISELEPEGRGPYAGAIGYIGYSGDMDTCIAIRTAVVEGGRAVVQAGAGIVADSVPSREWAEVLSKAEALVTAVAAGGTAGTVRSIAGAMAVAGRGSPEEERSLK